MKYFNLKTNKNSNKGITLIALVITIIVLLILAGITIAMIAGQDSAPQKAVEARNANKVGEAKDAASLLITGYIQDYYNGKYVGNETAAKSAENVGAYVSTKLANPVTKGEHVFQVADGVLNVSDTSGNLIVSGTVNPNGTITWNGEATNVGNSGNGGNSGSSTPAIPQDVTKVANSETDTEVTYTVTSFDKIVPSESNTVDFLPSEKNTIIIKGEQQVIIPAGFKVAEDSGTTIEEGIVIEDASEDENGQPTKKTGNQFVWIPVNQPVTYSSTYNNSSLKETLNESATSGTITLSRYDFGSSSSPTITEKSGAEVISSYFTETSSNSVARDIEDFKSKSNLAKGYYIGRYEMGKFSSTDNTVVCQANKTVVIDSRGNSGNTLTGAVKASRELYGIVTTGTEDLYTSDLVNSFAWDTAIVFIEKCGTKSNSTTYSWQNASYQTGKTTTGNNVQDSNGSKDEQCNIFDMSGNELEWTTEYSSYVLWDSGYKYLSTVERGSLYSNVSYYPGTCHRSYNWTTTNATGYRPILYILSAEAQS